MERTALDKYFLDRDINVIWNTIGHTEELVRAYVADTQRLVDTSKSKQSHLIKQLCYSLFYKMDSRSKFT